MFQQRGMTLIELLFVLVAVATATIILTHYSTGVLEYWGRQETSRRLAHWEQATRVAYERNLGTVINQTTSLELSVGTLQGWPHEMAPVASPFEQTGTGQVNSEVNRQLLAQFAASASPEEFSVDGQGRPWRIWVLGGLTEGYKGVSLRYAKIAVVSAGENGRFESFVAPGQPLALGGDDQGVVMDGLPLTRTAFDRSEGRVESVKEALERYYQARYWVDAGRDPARNYFANADPTASTPALLWDGGGSFPPVTTASGVCGWVGALGIAEAVCRTAWGEEITVESVSAATRHPANTDPARNTPPYTVVVRGGGSFVGALTRVASSHF